MTELDKLRELARTWEREADYQRKTFGEAAASDAIAKETAGKELVALISELPALTSTERIQLAEVTTDRDALLLAISRITTAVGLPEGFELDKVIRRIEELA